MDTIKSLAVISLLGAVLYYVYEVAGKPEKPMPPEVAAHAEALATLPQLDHGVPAAGNSPALLAPPKLSLPNPLSNVPAPPPPPPRLSPESKSSERENSFSRESARDLQVRPVNNWEEVRPKTENSRAEPPVSVKSSNQLRNSVYESPVEESAPPLREPIRPPVTEMPSPTPVPAATSAPAEPSRVTGASYTPSSTLSPQEIAAAQTRVRTYAFHQAWKAAQDQVQESRYREALLTLSAFYDDPAVPATERVALLEWLDALAARVVYSTEHYLEPEYQVRRNETLYTIAERYHVPYLLLKNINSVRDPELLLPGTKLKVVPGPFRAEVNLKRRELTLFVGGLYAGRFSVELGTSNVRPGEYTVKDKSNRKTFHSSLGTLASHDPRNPFGGIWLDLGSDVSLHGSAAEATPGGFPGSISLTPRDAEDVYGILSIGSQVLVRE